MLTNDQKKKINDDWEKSLVELLDALDMSEKCKQNILQNKNKLLVFLKATEIVDGLINKVERT